MITRIRTLSADETRSVGAVIARSLSGRMCFLLSGEYGAGKTTFVQGLAVGLEVAGPVRSPSYNIMKVYETGRQPLLHLDLYRTSAPADVTELGIEDQLPERGVVAIEWPGSYEAGRLDMPVIRIEFETPAGTGSGEPDEERLLTVTWEEEECPIALIEVLRAFAA